ncbi:AraC family transcriptional regulator [Marinomonas fungiae]|uniref:AraC family transcriptional regulator n=1 Tax=Marinomonas fungiae TaxID=1137284 RepID=UPI003A951028
MSNQHLTRINDVLFHIHQDISQELSAKSLADFAAYSEQHFHRVFKQVVGESVHQYIRRTRMEYAANQLMFASKTSIVDIAQRCGFQSVSSFNKAFKASFGMPPSAWRQHDTQTSSKPYLSDPEIAAGYRHVAQTSLPTPHIKDVPERLVAYVRHTGYGRSIRNAWLILKAWAQAEGRTFDEQLGLHHSNPAWVALDQCRYVACLAIDEPIKRRSVVCQLTIPEGLHAIFRLTGQYGELLPQISQVLEQWLPQSGFKLRSTPAYVHYHDNHFLNEDERFELDFYLPVSFF